MVVCNLYIRDPRYQHRVLVYTINVKEPIPQPQSSRQSEGLNNLAVDVPPQKLHKKKSCCFAALKISYVAGSVLNIVLSILLMAVTVSTAIALKIFSSEQSGRLVALIVLTVVAAITLSITIYAMVAVLRNQSRPVHGASVALLILAIIQAIIIGVTMRVTEEDEIKLTDSLAQSFQLAREGNPMNMKLWSTIQYDLTCCGVINANDYLNSDLDFFTPNIPISCCPSYDSDRSDLVQERDRQSCRARKEYFNDGCVNPVLELFTYTTNRVVIVAVLLIVLKVLLAILGLIWINIYKRRLEKGENQPSDDIAIKNISKP